MAVVQISRIQIRRGKASTGTGFPQLASGEMGWAVDTQELYIGNGSVAEGAPAVGNTKILTENNLTTQGNILNLIQHVYKKDNTNIQTGVSVNFPVSRSLQERLDDRVSTKDFGTVGDGVADDTAALQRAIDQLFLNPAFKASLDTTVGINARIILEVPAGRYKVTSTLYVPSYATIVGHGSNKTIIEFSGTGPAIQFINDSSTPASRVLQIALDDSGYVSDATLAPKFVSIKGLTVSVSGTQVGLQLDAVRDSSFENIIVKGAWNATPTTGNHGIFLKAASTVVTTEKNYFKKVSVVGFTTAVYSNTDIINNTFKDCFINDVRQGFILRESDPTTTIGQQFGPRNTEIENCDFDNVKRHAVYIGGGSGNTIISANFINVGNDGGSPNTPVYPQVYFRASGNAIKSFRSDRTQPLSLNTATAAYIPEVGGLVSYEVHSSRTITLSGGSAVVPAFRLPTCTNAAGGSTFSNPDPRHVTYSVNYVFRSPNYNYTRRGTMTISVDIETGFKQLSDDYDFAGADVIYSPVSALSTQLDFSVGLLDRNGNPFTGALGQKVGSVVIYKSNPISNDTGYLTYTYTATV